MNPARTHRYLLIILFLLSSTVFADETPVLARTGKSFDPSIPTLQSVLGYDFGQRITRHIDLERYLHELAKSSQKIKIERIGETYEGRALYYVIVSSEENIARLEGLRAANVSLADPRKLAPSDAERIIRSHPVFTGLNYSVHGDEHSGVEAGLALIYYFLASHDVETVEILRNCVLVIDPMQNPDGRERFIQYFNSTRGRTPEEDPQAAEHHQAWPGGRYNHYLFDMNRDWTVLSQKETAARIQAYRQYYSQVFIDVHEMGGDRTYFFPPPSPPQNPNVPESTRKWWKLLGKAIAKEFDSRGIAYFTEENYDFWYPGYGDSWPTYNGAVAGTFEQGSLRGLVRKRSDDIVIHYQDAIWNHFLASLATVRMSSQNREEILHDFYRFRSSAIEEGKTGSIRQIFIPRAADPLQADRLVEKLLLHGIEVSRIDSDFVTMVHPYTSDDVEVIEFTEGDYIIFTAQPLKRLIQALFEKETLPDPAFLEAEEQRRREKEPTEFYDISAWSMPLAYGMEVYWSSDTVSVDSTRIVSVAKIQPVVPAAGYAYLLNYDSNHVIAAAAELLRRHVRVYFSTKPFQANGKAYVQGTLIVRIKDNIDNLRQVLEEVSASTGVQFDGTDSGWTEEGPDLGSDAVVYLEKPRIGILMNIPVDPTSYGALFYLMDQRYHLPFVSLPSYRFSSTDLSHYNVLVLPDSSWGKYDSLFESGQIKKLKAWVEAGGTLIALQNASSFLSTKKDLSGVKQIDRFLKDSLEPAPEKEEGEEWEEKEELVEETEAADVIPGSILRATINRKHFLCFGYDSDEIPVFVYSSNVFVAPPNSRPVVAYAGEDRLKISGLLWDIAAKRLEGKAYLTEESLGKGHVILFAEDPSFRAYWEGLHKLLFNGMLFGPSL